MKLPLTETVYCECVEQVCLHFTEAWFRLDVSGAADFIVLPPLLAVRNQPQTKVFLPLMQRLSYILKTSCLPGWP